MITDILVGSFNENTLKQFLDTHGSVGFHTLHTKLTDLKVQLSQVYHDNYKKMFKVSSGALTLSGEYHTAEDAANDFLEQYGLSITGNIEVETTNDTVIVFEVVEQLAIREI